MPKKHVVSLRMNDLNFSKLEKVANQLNMKKSDVLKLALEDNLSKYRPIKLSRREKHYLFKNRRSALNYLGKLSTEASSLSRKWLLAGNNINQLAHKSNMTNGNIDFSLNSSIVKLTNQLSRNKLIKQNNLLIRRLTKIWQLLE